MKAIFLHLRSDFAHWRNPFSISVLETFLAPQKTTVLGIVGALAGLGESEIEELQSKIKVGIKIKKIESICMDIVRLVNLKEGKSTLTPTARQLLFRPEYEIVIIGSEKTIEELEKKVKKYVFPAYAGISELLGEVSVNIVKDNTMHIERGKNVGFINTSIPYKNEHYSWDKVSSLVIPPRVFKKTISFYKNRKRREFLDIIEGYGVKIIPSWEVEFLVYNNEFFPVF